MGKNRNSKKEPCQSYQVVPEDENCFQETETDFMTSDNFCIVQKRKHSKKTSDDVSQLPRSRFDLKSFSDVNAPAEDSNSNSTGFWKRKADEVAEQSSDLRKVGEANEEFACFSSLSHSKFKLPGMKDTAGNVESPLALFDAMTVASDRQVVSRSQAISPECDSLERVSSNDGHVLQDEPEENHIGNAIDSDGYGASQYRADEKTSSKKKSDNSSKAAKKKKSKEHKVKLDEELEKLIKELDLDDTQKSKKNPANSLDPTETIEKSTVSTCKKRKKRNSKTLNNEVFTSGSLNVDMTESSGGSIGVVNSDPRTAVNGSDMENHVAESCNKKKKVKRSRDKQKSSIESDSPNSDVTESGQIQSEDKERVDDDVPNAKEVLKKSCKNEETEKKDKKKLGKKVLAVIQEALKKAKQEEERLKSEEAAKKRAAEEAERAQLEKLRLEQEKKEKKKLKERQRRERLKAEGRLLSKSQKQSRARIEATLAALRQQGVNIPQAGEKKPHGPRLGNDKTMHRRRCDSLQSNQGIDTQVTSNERTKSESLSSQESGKYSLSDLPSSFDSKDSWEISSMEESSALTAESGHLSCSEESDILDMDEPSDSHKEIVNTKTNQIEKPDITNHLNVTNGISKDDKTKSVKLRSPIVCVLGHVDTGKTKILDYIRKTHVQDGEAGGITQQIGATMIPLDALKEKCKMVQNFSSLDLRVPGLLVIDTPGHESFGNLRFRGSSICDIAILVVDIMHGLEPQTIESINLLKAGKTPFIVALNKVDRIYGWKSSKDSDIRKTIDSQSQAALAEFRKRCQNIILEFANQCINAALFYENNDPRSFVSMVPTSAISGDGIGNILGLIVQLTQSMLHKKLIFSDELQAIVLEVKAISGLGTTIDVILVNGSLRESDTIVLAGHDGPFVSQIRSLLMPQSLKELRVKNPYKEYKHVEGAQGVKISGRDLEKAIAGFPLYKAENNSKIDSIKSELNVLFGDYMNCIKTSERGVYVQASTLGSLEALLELLKSSDIPYFAVKIGPVVKKDVTKASIMLEHDNQYACILAFDVKVERDAQELADTLGVRIFHADIIYHLFDMYVQFREELRMKKVEEIKRSAVFPCKLKVLPEFVYSSKDPIILGVSVEAGTLKEGTPLCVPSRDLVEIGLVTSIKFNNKPISSAKKGEEVCVKIEPKQGDSQKTYGKHFDHEDVLVSRITRPSIDVCKEFYRDELLPSDWQLMVELKKMLYIM